LFIVLLPFGVIEYFGVFEVPLVVAISACFLLIEKMAIHLQDPFENKPTDTPMTTIAKGIEKNLVELYVKPEEEPVLPQKGYVDRYRKQPSTATPVSDNNNYPVAATPSYYVL